ncbi:hypothetical protein MRO89_14550 [Dickeya dianthicola]|uniref:hypothetical protein n=1 Tax=Dickeya dianthicola TaxID=204039 RepID=UPI001F60118B|nr:hypothetical protein [Dickeya dianthicola]MCI4187171.1 hypothetical protein [Dickeya dianthicola]
MAKVVISISSDGVGGVGVRCKPEHEKGDSNLVKIIAMAVAAGLAGHVSEKVRNAINKSKEKKHVH